MMIHKGLISFFLIATMQSVIAQDPDDSFIPKLFHNEDRIFLLFSPSVENTQYQQQMNVLIDNQDYLEEREVALYKLFEREGYNPENKSLVSAHVLQLREHFDIQDDQFALLYVTVNGVVQMRKETVVNIETITEVLNSTLHLQPEYESY